MPDLLIPNLRPETIDFLKRRAAPKGHSLETEVLEILDSMAQEARTRREEFWKRADQIRGSLRGTEQTDSANLRRIGRRGESG